MLHRSVSVGSSPLSILQRTDMRASNVLPFEASKRSSHEDASRLDLVYLKFPGLRRDLCHILALQTFTCFIPARGLCMKQSRYWYRTLPPAKSLPAGVCNGMVHVLTLG